MALALLLLVGTAARGETKLSRAKNDRAVTVAGTPAEPLPEIHVAPDVPTLLWFPADIQRNTLTVDASRIRVLDTGARSVIVQAADDYRAGERRELAVFFADGAAPSRAAFVLVMDPAAIDIRIDVKRPEQPAAPCPAEVQHADPRPEDFVLKGFVDKSGVQTGVVEEVVDDAQGLSTDKGMLYRGKGWVLFDISINNLSGRLPFSPRGATLTGKGEVTLQARLVTPEMDAIPPGKSARVLVVVDEPPASVGGVFALEVLGDADRHLVLPRVVLPVAVSEDKR
ncbi:DUF2381 family protein [Hyalangium versicolor]|uniref:DUF2381 family protein n=1 Tax=Hyalangium versicolor TaxID=2861190 RepID=UPI00359F4F60